MEIRDVMTPDIELVTPEETLGTAAQLMAELDLDALPVGEDNRLIGMITGRDIAMRVVAKGDDPKQAAVAQAMTSDALYCFEDEPVDNVAQKMANWWVRRLPVVNSAKRLVGMVSLADLTALQVTPKSRAVRMRARRLQTASSTRQLGHDRKMATAA